MRVVVDLNRCQAYAQCCYTVPDRFVLRGDEILVYDPARFTGPDRFDPDRGTTSISASAAPCMTASARRWPGSRPS
jgi:ferredoxin